MVRKIVALNPAMVLYVLNALIAMVAAWGWHLSTDKAGAIDTIAAGVLALIAAVMVRPITVSVVVAAAVTVLTAFSAFGLHLTGSQVSTTAAVASILLGALLHAIGVPVVAANQGKTATQLLLEEKQPGARATAGFQA